MKKRLLSVIMVVCMLALLLSACSSSQKNVSDGDKNGMNIPTVTEGTLTVATSPDFAPYEFYAIDKDGTPQLAGFDIALAKYIADYLGLELEIVTMDFDGVLSEVGTKSVDIGMSGISPDPSRLDAMDFSDIYYEGTQALVCLNDKVSEYQTMEDVNVPGVTVGAQIGSIQMDLAQENTPDADIVALPKITDIVSELVTGKLDAAYMESVVAESYQKNYPQLQIAMNVPYEENGFSIGVSKGNKALLEGVNEAIAAALSDGSMAEYVATANEQASGEIFEGLLEEDDSQTGNSFINAKNFSKIKPYAKLFKQGMIVTILLSVFTVLIGFCIALLLALMRMSNIRPFRSLGLDKNGHLRERGFLLALSKFNPVSFLASAYVEILRSTPVIVQIFFIYYGVFGLIDLPAIQIFGFIKFNRFFPGVVALGMNSGAYLCEIMRAGIQSIDGGQTEAARSLGLSRTKTFRYVIMPQALKNILPAIANEFVVIIKESAITYTIGVQDIMFAVNAVKGATFVIIEPLLVATLIYFCLCFPTSKIIAYFERKMSHGDKK